jgi:hypothetical protein
MGTITGQQIADRAWTKVNEATGSSAIRWTPAEALMWINDGQRECVNQLPQAWSKRAIPTLVTGNSRQDFAGLSISDGISLIDVICNYNSGCTVRGRATTKRERAWLDDQKPDWHTTSGGEVVHWMYDERDPKAFYIFPQPSAAAKLEIIYAANPTDLATLASAITIDDIYANALQFFVLFSFYSKDATYTKNPQSAAAYWQLFMQSLGLRGQNIAGSDKIGTVNATGVIA